MPLLFPNLRISQVFGANTDVGKTLLTTALVRASALRYRGAGEAATAADGTSSRKRVFYLKPVSTGPDNESDVSYVERHTADLSGSISTHNLYQYREPMSPHLAAQLAPDLTNAELVRGVSQYATQCASDLGQHTGALYVETAGGVHSPSIHSSHTQSTSLLPLRLPSVLIAAPQLGGISTTLSAYESLHLRGYHLSAVLCLEHDYYRNHEFLREYFSDRGIKFWSLPPPPERYGTEQEDKERLARWYASIESPGAGAEEVAQWLDDEHVQRMEGLQGMPKRTLDSVWWPFTQHGLVNKPEDVMVIDSAEGDHFDAYYAPPTGATSESSPTDSLLKPYFDGAASWFTQSHGHAATPLTLAAAHAAGRYGHVLFPSGTHAPALELAEKLKETAGRGWADRVFYSDNGSTGTEVALKMALRAAGRRYGWEGEEGVGVGVIGLRGGYHGDTIGSMDASEPSTFNKAVDWYKGRGHWFSPPIVQYRNGKPTIITTGPDTWPSPPSSSTSTDQNFTPTPDGWTTEFSSVHDIYDLSSRSSSPLATYYRQHIRSTLADLVKQGRRFGAVMMEPTCLGAGGMLFVDPLFQSCLIEVVRASADLFGGAKWEGEGYEERLSKMSERDAAEWSGLPIIYDEVFSGMHRFGYHTASSILSHTPDISVYAKILTGGLLPLSATLASKSIFDAFLSDKKVDALLHGHSYTANPVGCAVALEAVKMIERHEKAGGWEKDRAMWGQTPLSLKETAKDDAVREKVKGELQEARWSFWHPDFVRRVSGLDKVQGVMALGTVCAIELKDDEGGYSSHKALDFLTNLRKTTITPEGSFEAFQMHSRPLGNVLYFMTSLFTEPEVVRAMEKAIERQLRA